jgi:hypothetical protein
MRCIRGLRHGTGKNDAGRDRVTPNFLYRAVGPASARSRLAQACSPDERSDIRERHCKLHCCPRVSLRSPRLRSPTHCIGIRARLNNSIYYSSIAQFARDTYDLILDIERELALIGSTPFSDLLDLAEAWQRRGSVFWDRALNP